MSAIGGIYNFDDGPADEQQLGRLAHNLKSSGPDSNAFFLSDSIGMIYRAFHTNRESRNEIQPFVSGSGVVLTWDGRLDNRAQLFSILGGKLNDDKTDVAIVMQAYLSWGVEFLSKLVGDFALALWDSRSTTLCLARDAIGPRTLYYNMNDRRIIWATELSPLLGLSGTRIEINDEYVAGFLTKLPAPGLTPYRDFHSVAPAHALLVHGSHLRSMQFWKPEPQREIRYRTDSEYEDHFRALFGEAVAFRLRVTGTAWAELSGGMDSSPIVCMANELISRGEVEASSLKTVSRVYDEASQSDERRYISAVEQKIGRAGIHLREDDHRILQPWGDEYIPCVPSYVAAFRAYYRALDKLMKADGSRVLLTGFGGDEIQLGDGEPFPELIDLLFKGRLLKLFGRSRAWSQSKNEPHWRFLQRTLLKPLLPRRLQGERNRIIDTLLKFYNPRFVERMRLRDRLFDGRNGSGSMSLGSHYRTNQFLYSMKQLSGGFWRELCNIEFSYPFAHRPLVEFMLAIPAEQIARPNESKSLCKRALRNLLPPELLTRKETRITIWHAASLTATREAPRLRRLFVEADPFIYEYLNRNVILSALDRDSHPDVLLLSLVPFVHWLQTVQRRQATSSNRAETKAA